MTDDASASGPADDRPGPLPGAQGQFALLPAGEAGPATVRAAGDIDLTNVGLLESALGQAAAASNAVTVDLTAVAYCDSAGIRALITAARRARLTIRVSPAGPVTETLLKVSGLDQVAVVEVIG